MINVPSPTSNKTGRSAKLSRKAAGANELSRNAKPAQKLNVKTNPSQTRRRRRRNSRDRSADATERQNDSPCATLDRREKSNAFTDGWLLTISIQPITLAEQSKQFKK